MSHVVQNTVGINTKMKKIMMSGAANNQKLSARSGNIIEQNKRAINNASEMNKNMRKLNAEKNKSPLTTKKKAKQSISNNQPAADMNQLNMQFHQLMMP